MDQLVIDTIIEKIDSSESRLDEQGTKLAEVSKKVSVMTDQSNTIKAVAELVRKLQDNLNALSWPVKEMTEMSNRLAANNELLANPAKTKQVVFHTAGKLAWVVIGLFMGMIFLIIGWVNTSNKLDQYRMHDIMWRYIKLTNQSQNLEYLQSVERLYLGNQEKFQSFVEQQELQQKQIEESRQNAVNAEEPNKRYHGNTDTDTSPSRKKKHKFQ